MSSTVYDVFISFQWDSKQQAILLARKLQDYNKDVFLDELGIELNQCRMRSKVVQGIKSSKVFIILLTKNYCESINSSTLEVQEPYLAHTIKVPFIVLMMEHVNMISMGILNVFMKKVVKFDIFNSPSMMREWGGDMWDSILKEIADKRRAGLEAADRMGMRQKMGPVLTLDMF